MGKFLFTTLVLALLYLIIKQVVKSFHCGKVQSAERKRILIILLTELIGVGVGIVSDECSLYYATALIAVGAVGLYFMTLSFVPKVLGRLFQYIAIALEIVCVLYSGAALIWPLPLPSLAMSLNITMAAPLLICCVYVAVIAVRISDIKFVLKTGAAWNSVCLVTDVIYIVIFQLYTAVYFLMVFNFPTVSSWIYALYSLAVISLQYAMVVRINSSSLFVFWEEQVRRFIESMRLTHSDLTMESPGVDVLYKNIYDRVIEYFDSHRPYLNSELTINDIVNALYTNKLYISKAISMHTGRNFCQFVNYYRVTYAVELFRKDTTLKIVDVAARSGFNSSVSFSMAFRLYIGEKPSDWFRRERVRLSKRKK